MRKVIFYSLVNILVYAFCTHAAWAVDGVTELNQACVDNGCLADDDHGFPIEIKHGGSYRLTGNLLVPDADTTGIVVFASHVSIDLNGFSIKGVTECTGEPATCSNTGTGRGISADSASLPVGLSVFNGHIVGMGLIGIFSLYSGNILDVHVSQCGGIGIFAAANTHMSRVTATFNGSDGVQAQVNITIADSQFAYNGESGLYIQNDGVVSNSSAYNNGNSGIVVGSGSVVSNSNAVSNASSGFLGGSGVLLRGNTSLSNAFGFAADEGSLLENNIARSNTSYGLQLSTDTVYRGNSITENTTGPLSPISPGVNGGNNYCAGPNTSLSSCP